MARINGLFENPYKEWEKIGAEYIPSFFSLFKTYFAPFFLLYPTVFLAFELFPNPNLRKFFMIASIPIIFLVLYLIFLRFLAWTIEETNEFWKGKVHPQAGWKIAYFSSLPLLVLLTAFPIPYLGKLLASMGFFYQAIHLYRGGKTLLGCRGNLSVKWMLSIALTFILLIFTILLTLVILSLIFHFF